MTPTYNKGANYGPDIHKVVIHKQDYYWWSVRHMLVWSDYRVYEYRHQDTKDRWMNSHRIPILELSSKLIYPRVDVSIDARWCLSSPSCLIKEMERGLTNLNDSMIPTHDHVDPLDLRIRTPLPQDDEEDWTPDTNDRICHAPRVKSWSAVSDEIERDLTETGLYMSPCARRLTQTLVLGFLGFLTVSAALSIF